MRRTLLLVSLASLLGGLLADARATKPRCRLERLDPAQLSDGKIRLFASALELEGEVIEGLGSGQFTLLINGKNKGKAESVQPFSAAREPVYIALVVEVAAQYKKALPAVKRALTDFLSEQPPSLKVMLIPFGSDNPQKATAFIPAPAMVEAVDNLEVDEDSVDVQMTKAIDVALAQLAPMVPPPESGQVAPRRLIVVISDGLNERMDRAHFKLVGEKSAKAGVPIHTVAYSPNDSRGPLLNLGDLSKRSNGTFRWVQISSGEPVKPDEKKPTDEDEAPAPAKKAKAPPARKEERTRDEEADAEHIKKQLDTLADEVRKQYVITFPTSISSTEKLSFGVICRDLRSNVLGGRGQFGFVPTASAGLGWLLWALIILGGIVVLGGALFVVGLVLRRRTPPMPPGAQPRPSQVMGAQQQPHPSQQWQAQQPHPSQQRPAQQPSQQWQAQQPHPSQQRPAQQPSQSMAAQPATGRGATLIAVTGPLAGQRVPAQHGLTFGSAPGNAVVIPDPSVAPRHCMIYQDQYGFIVQDAGSTTGTFLNGRPVQQPQRLVDGSLLRLGENTQFKFRVE